MCFRQVNDIDIVADTTAVRCVIVVTEDFELLAQTGSCLRYERQQVLRHAVRQFADECRGVRTDRIEVTKQDSVEVSIGMCLITDNLLVDLLGVAVRRQCLLNRRVLIDGQMVGIRLTIDGA